jgi:hypothetical protein
MPGMDQPDAPFVKIVFNSPIHGLVHERIIVHAERMVNAYNNIAPGRAHADIRSFIAPKQFSTSHGGPTTRAFLR